jgi:hypothetical protein
MGRIRKKIDEAMDKFQEYKGFPCGLVLHNQGAPLVHLETAEIMFAQCLGIQALVLRLTRGVVHPQGQRRGHFWVAAK